MGILVLNENYFTYIKEKLENTESEAISESVLNQKALTTSQHKRLTGIIEFLTQNDQTRLG